MGEGIGNALLHLGRVLEPYRECRRPRPSPKFGFWSSVPKSRTSVDFCSSSMKPSAPSLKTTTFTGSPCCASVRKSPDQHGEPPSPDSEIHLRPGNEAWAPIACAIAFAIEPCQNEPNSRRLPFMAR